MKTLLSIFICLLAWTATAPVYSESLDTQDLTELYQAAAADKVILLGFSDQSLETIPDLAVEGYRKRGNYGSTTWAERITTQLAEDHHLRKLTEWPMTEVGMHCAAYQLPPSLSMADALRQLAGDRRVEFVQPMHYYKTQAHQYNDPYFKLQDNLHQMQVDQAHTKTTGKHITIAMIDTGVALDHPELKGQISHSENFAEGISASFSDDKHGTAVAGVMVAKKDNDTGISGIAPDAKLIALKACWPDQVGGMAAVCNSLTLALAINAAIRANVNILNMSLTGPEDPLLALLISKAIAKGILVVAASNGSKSPAERFPASLENVIAVETLAANPQTFLTVTAPGEKILTTLPQGTYDFISGSSVAAAEVSGVIALLLQLKSDLTVAETQSILQKSSVKQGRTAASVNASAAVLSLCEQTTCPQEQLSLLAIRN